MNNRESDERELELLHLKLNAELPARHIRERTGRTNSAIQGIMHRYRNSILPCECAKPENMDGGMPSRWWKSHGGKEA